MNEKIEAETEAPLPHEGEVEDEEVEGDETDEEPVSELIEQAGRAAGLLASGKHSSPQLATRRRCGERFWT